MNEVAPGSLKDAPALIEAVFPAQKVSFEAQRERKAGAGQTLTALGSYWKGRKPLILVRAIILGSLLPQTADSEKDLEIFEKLMGFDDHGLARRAFVQNELKPKDIAARISLSNPWDFFTFTGRDDLSADDRLLNLECPFEADEEGISLRWDRDTSDEAKLRLMERTLATFSTYEERASFCKRPEEVDQSWLYAPIWHAVNDHYARWGIKARSFPELVEKLGILRFGHRPQVADTFSGGGSIPFEAAQLGCDVYASDLNPIASMLTWGSLNVIGSDRKRRSEIEKTQRQINSAVDAEIRDLGIEFDEVGNRAKVHLYCLETRCPETGWLVPMAPSWVISKQRNVIAKLVPDPELERFEIEVVSNVSSSEMAAASRGTIDGGALTYMLDGKSHRVPVRTLRGDSRDSEGSRNLLRRWEKRDFEPRPGDILQERLYAIQWIYKETIDRGRHETFFREVKREDLERERAVSDRVSKWLMTWQEQGLVPDMEIEPGEETTRLLRERGWTHWHHLFNPRQLLIFSTFKRLALEISDPELAPAILAVQSKSIEWNTRLCRWATSSRHENQVNTFSNQALNTLFNYAARAMPNLENHTLIGLDDNVAPISTTTRVDCIPASEIKINADLFITDPPYADAVNYHEITEFFIAWLRRNPPSPFDEWVWDSRRALAIKGSGDDFRRGMVDAYRAMAEHMPDNGMQCVMFTHQDTGVWSDMVGIFWAAGLQVVAAWYIATETTSELKKGGYVQGTVILMLRKRPAGERSGFKQRILPAVRTEVERQIESMMHLNDEVKDKLGEPVFNDSDLQMAGYAAALKVLTAYTHIGGDDVRQASRCARASVVRRPSSTRSSSKLQKRPTAFSYPKASRLRHGPA